MRIIISLALFFMVLSVPAQRVSFDDPDLTFSFKKPKGWQVFDDGYVVKVAPSESDTAIIYFSITYFEDARPKSETDLDFLHDGSNDESRPTQPIKIAGTDGQFFFEEKANSVSAEYYFKKLGQRFEIFTLHPSEDREMEKTLRKIVRSVKVNQ